MERGKQVITIEVISESYSRLNVWKVGSELGLSGQQVHSKLTKAGLIHKMNYFTECDMSFLKEEYPKFRDKGKISELAKIMNRTPAFLNRKAKVLGVTQPGVRISMKLFAKELSATRKEFYKTHQHPKGMLGKKQSEEFKAEASVRLKKAWSNQKNPLNSEEYKQRKSDYMSKRQASGELSNNYSNAKSGTVIIADKKYFYRSSWEVNIAAYLQFMKERNEIKDWEYEPKTFWFEKIKRGVRSYKPDFLVQRNNGTSYFIEVKGWMDPKSITKLARMKIYYPEVEIDIIDVKRYNGFKKHASLFKYWGSLDSDEHRVKEIKCTVDGCKNKQYLKGLCRSHYQKVFKK